MDAADDIAMVDVGSGSRNPNDYSDLLTTNHSDAFAFSDQEKIALELYDQLRELDLQQSILKAQTGVEETDVSVLSDDVLNEQLIIAEREAMEARAEYELRNRVTHNVLVMDPTLKAVHGGERTDFIEKRLLPLIQENDILSMIHSSMATKLVAAHRSLHAAEQGNIAANEENQGLSKTLLELAEEMKRQSVEDIEDPQLRSKVDAVEKSAKESRRRMLTLKGIVSGMIVGSGINWAEDEVLRDLVMDDEED